MQNIIQPTKFRNCVELTLPLQNSSVAFFLPTAENAKMLALLIRRCLHEEQFTTDIKFSTPEGMMSAQKAGPEIRSIDTERLQHLYDVREKKASHRLHAGIRRDACYGGDVDLTLYFYSHFDALVAFNLMKLGLLRTYAKFTLDRNEDRQGFWVPREPETFGDPDIVDGLRSLPAAARITAKAEILEVIRRIGAGR